MQWASYIFASSLCFAALPAPEYFPECTHPSCSGHRADMGCLLWCFVVMPSRPARPWRRDCSVHCRWLLSCPLRPSTEHGDSPFRLCLWLSSWLLWRLPVLMLVRRLRQLVYASSFHIYPFNFSDPTVSQSCIFPHIYPHLLTLLSLEWLKINFSSQRSALETAALVAAFTMSASTACCPGLSSFTCLYLRLLY